MPTSVISIATAEHYKWGGAQNTDCDGWYLVGAESLSVIEELMPAGTSESRHYHKAARQFFYVLEGELTIEVEHHLFPVRHGEGIEVHPGQAHQAMNRSDRPLRMLVISQPPSHEDRVPA